MTPQQPGRAQPLPAVALPSLHFPLKRLIKLQPWKYQMELLLRTLPLSCWESVLHTQQHGARTHGGYFDSVPGGRDKSQSFNSCACESSPGISEESTRFPTPFSCSDYQTGALGLTISSSLCKGTFYVPLFERAWKQNYRDSVLAL